MRGADMPGTGALLLATLDVSPVHQSYPDVRCIVIGHCVKRLVHHRPALPHVARNCAI
jgi:hypothetical protein